ncbi:MAG: hypothetical protein K6G64_03030 [Eubacterium sp.]|nr:hypothetical protein [Eubacterium sp.]
MRGAPFHGESCADSSLMQTAPFHGDSYAEGGLMQSAVLQTACQNVPVKE